MATEKSKPMCGHSLETCHTTKCFLMTPNELLAKARAAAHNDLYKEANDYWLMLDTMASAGRLPREWMHW